MDPNPADPATLAAHHLLARAYGAVFAFVRQRALGGDRVAQGFVRELSQPVLPAPSRQLVRSWLGNVSAEARLFNRSSDPYLARDLVNQVHAAEARAGAMGPAVWAEVVTGIRNGTLG